MIKANVKDVVLAVTYRCNSRCRMCNIWQRTDHEGELLPEDLKKLPKSVKDLNFTGGEPFLRQDIVELVRVATEHLPKAHLMFSSNGFATDLILTKMKEILAINPKVGVALSLDGVGEMHDQVRGIPGGFERVLETLKGLKALGVKNLRFGFTMGDYNYEHLPKVYKLAGELGIEMTLAVVHSAENYFGKENELAAKDKLIEQLTWLIKQELRSFQPKRWLRAYFAYGMREYLRTGQRLLPDYSGELNWFIDPFGNIYPCDVSSQKIGKLKSAEMTIKMVCDPECSTSWMICTARHAMRKHKWQVLAWIMRAQLKALRAESL